MQMEEEKKEKPKTSEQRIRELLEKKFQPIGPSKKVRLSKENF